jgi:hypothetical protein
MNRYSVCGNPKWHEAVVEIGSFNGNVLCCQEFLNLLKRQMLYGLRVDKRYRRNQQDKNNACRHNKDTQNPSNPHRNAPGCTRTLQRTQARFESYPV